MNIHDYIKDLLIDNDCVIVPGLGGFVANYQSAQLVGVGHIRFVPPSRRLMFNAKLNYNDGLLVSYVASKQQLSLHEAQNIVTENVQTIKKALRNEHSYQFDGLGLLQLNVDNRLVFDAFEQDGLLADSFGLSPFMMPALQSVRAKQHASFKDKSPQRSLVMKKIAKRAVVVVPLLLLLAILPTISIKQIQQSSLSLIQLFSSNSKPIEPIEPDAPKTIKNNVVIEKQVVAGQYHIITGCFKSKETAESMSNQFRIKGYKSSTIEMNGLYKVSLQSYNNDSAAHQELQQFVAGNPQFSDAWVMKIDK